jgi:hypothetical protein
MSYTTITRFSNCDILISKNDVEYYGFPKTKTEGEMIDLAIEYRCPIIVKNGNKGKWYLKGRGKQIADLKNKIDENLGKSRDGVFCLLIQ